MKQFLSFLSWILNDFRFGLLFTVTMACYHWGNFLEFREQDEYITNKLAFLIHDVTSKEYIPIILAIIAAFGVHSISPFFAKTKRKSSHSELQIYFDRLYGFLHHHNVDGTFFDFDKPVFFNPLYLSHGVVDTEYNWKSRRLSNVQQVITCQ